MILSVIRVIARPYFSLSLALGAFALNLVISALGATAAAVLVVTVENKWDRRLWKGVACYWLFLLSWLPITVGCYFKKTTVWEEIRHTRNVAPQPGGKSRQALMP